MMKIPPKSSIAELKAYDPCLFKGRYKLDANENPYGMPAALIKEILAKAASLDLNRYPQPGAPELRKTLGKKLKVNSDNIVVGNGSDELLLYLMMAYLEAGDGVIAPVPSFEMYGLIGKALGGKFIPVPLDKNFDLDDANIIKLSCKNKTKFIFITYPNNPTGNCFSRERIINILDNTSALIVIDEAYFEFSGKTFLPLLKKYPNLIITRTFSKAFSMAGLRLGYMAASEEICNNVNKVRLPYNINSLSMFIAMEAMKNERQMKNSLDIIKKEREKMFKVIKSEYTAVKSDANFIFLKLNNAKKAKFAFEKSGISIRMFSKGPAAGWARITVGKPAENTAVLKILKRGV